GPPRHTRHSGASPSQARAMHMSGSDNEAILHLITEQGTAGVGALRGMYAFAVAGADGLFVAGRDPVGIKPLYWARRDGAVRFASEIRAFPPAWRPLVEAFPPGCCWTPEAGLVQGAAVAGTRPVAQMAGLSPLPPPVSPPDLLATIRDAIVLAVERRMMADVPVGVFLSGGLDSSLVAAVAARHAARRGVQLSTFAVGTPDSPDLLAARVVAHHLDTDHHERVYTPDDAMAVLPAVIAAMESYEPSLVRSAVPNYLLAELAARHVKVVLTGEGADELFAGYEYLREISDAGELHEELVRSVAGLHHLNLQRCDRVTMAHSLEARVPFLDLDVIRLALALPASWKLPAPGRMAKHVLREAFAGWLPAEIVWRTKAQFGDGSGATAALGQRAALGISDADLAAAQAVLDPPPRTREELAYRRLFSDHLPGIRPHRVLGRFATA
ncbi:MAG: asparagine synthase-related protein, partial [Egibacteraceae bacterium]